MKDGQNNSDNMENKAQKFFQKRAESFKAGKDLWSKLEPRLDEKQKVTEPANRKERFWQWLAGPRLVAITTSVGVLVILATAGSIWLTNNNTANHNTSSSVDRAAIEKGLGTTFGGTYGAYIQTSIVLTNPSGAFPPVTTMAATTTTAVFGAINSAGSSYTWGDNLANNTAVTGKQVISQASVSLNVTNVSTALNQVETMAQNLGGSVDNMNSSGAQNQQQANVTIRVPANQFLTALNQLQGMGTVENQNINTQDVTQQYIDLQAQLTSAQMEEQSLQAILAKATTVSDEIAIQDQLTQVIAQVENLQGQINYMQNQVAMSTITVNLNTPQVSTDQAPSGTLSVAVGNVDNTIASVKQLISGVNGIINSSTVSFDNGKESAYLSLQVYTANFDQVMAALGKKGKIEQKTVQEAGTSQLIPAQQSNNPPDASIYLTLTEPTGFWTAAHITIIAAGAFILVVLIIILTIAGRAGMLRKKTA
jgi:Domain of unknown function (DUF4349)